MANLSAWAGRFTSWGEPSSPTELFMPPPPLHPGDVLLYCGSGPVSWAIKVKTWSRISHAEIYIGNGMTWTSRDLIGSNFYPFTDEHLDTVLRPVPECQGDLIAGIAWAKQYTGRPYDTWGLLRFFRLGKYSTEKFFCSEAVVQFCRAAGMCIVNPNVDADTIAPGDFLKSPHLIEIWRKPPNQSAEE